MVQTQFQPEAQPSEPRFHPETVQKAVSLAQRLQQERRETLSLTEIDQMAAELGIEPGILRHALNTVSREAAEKHTPPVTSAVQPQARQSHAPIYRTVLAILFGLAAVGLLLLTLLFLWVAQDAPGAVLPPPSSVVSESRGVEVTNGEFQRGPSNTVQVNPGEEVIPGWTVVNGPVTYLRAGGRRVVQLGTTGGIRQLVPTQPYQTYQVEVRIAGEPQNVASMARVRVSAGGILYDLDTFVPARGVSPAQVATGSWEFQATEAGTTIEIVSAPQPNEVGKPIVESVSVTPVLGSTAPPAATF